MYTKGECAFIGCGATAKFIYETLESAADRGYGVIVEPVGTENSRAFNLYQVTTSKAKAAPDLCEALKELYEWARLSYSDDTGEWADKNDPAIMQTKQALAKTKEVL